MNLKINGRTCGEIDIMEHVGYDPDVVHSSVHTKDYNFMERNNATESIRLRNVKKWHVYGVEWSESEIIFSIDGKAYHTLERGDRSDANWPFLAEDKYHVILNIAVGGHGVELEVLILVLCLILWKSTMCESTSE